MARLPRAAYPAAGFLFSTALSRHMATLDLRILFADRSSDPAWEGFRGPGVYLFWHEYIPFLMYLRPHARCALLVSNHADAEALSHIARFRGLGVVRGSSRRGGEQALRELIGGRLQNIVITPDGPRGPRRTVAVGGIYLASRLGLPIIAVGIGYDRPWRLPTWDRFAVPRPFTRGRGIFGVPRFLPPGLDRDALESERQAVEVELNGLTDRAEAWAGDGYRVAGEVPVYPAAASRRPTPPRRPGGTA